MSPLVGASSELLGDKNGRFRDSAPDHLEATRHGSLLFLGEAHPAQAQTMSLIVGNKRRPVVRIDGQSQSLTTAGFSSCIRSARFHISSTQRCLCLPIPGMQTDMKSPPTLLLSHADIQVTEFDSRLLCCGHLATSWLYCWWISVLLGLGLGMLSSMVEPKARQVAMAWAS